MERHSTFLRCFTRVWVHRPDLAEHDVCDLAKRGQEARVAKCQLEGVQQQLVQLSSHSISRHDPLDIRLHVLLDKDLDTQLRIEWRGGGRRVNLVLRVCTRPPSRESGRCVEDVVVLELEPLVVLCVLILPVVVVLLAFVLLDRLRFWEGGQASGLLGGLLPKSGHHELLHGPLHRASPHQRGTRGRQPLQLSRSRRLLGKRGRPVGGRGSGSTEQRFLGQLLLSFERGGLLLLVCAAFLRSGDGLPSILLVLLVLLGELVEHLREIIQRDHLGVAALGQLAQPPCQQDDRLEEPVTALAALGGFLKAVWTRKRRRLFGSGRLGGRLEGSTRFDDDWGRCGGRRLRALHLKQRGEDHLQHLVDVSGRQIRLLARRHLKRALAFLGNHTSVALVEQRAERVSRMRVVLGISVW